MPAYVMYELKVTPDPPAPKPLPLSYTTRLSRLRLPPQQKQLLWEANERAIDLYNAAVNWKHPTNFFDAYRTSGRLWVFRELISTVTTKRKPTANTFNRPDWKGFLERPMTEEELTNADDWKPKPLEVFEFVHSVIQDGYDLSLSFNHNYGSATATLKDVREGRVTGGYALSAKDENAASALKLVLYKHFTILERDWSQLLDQPKRTKRG